MGSATERLTLTVLGAALLVGLSVFLWQRRTPSLTARRSAPPIDAASWDRALEQARRVRVNAATAEELERLPGIGPALAQRIVEYRAAHGPFPAVEALLQVRGIGPETLHALARYLSVD